MNIPTAQPVRQFGKNLGLLRFLPVSPVRTMNRGAPIEEEEDDE
jgi:hypothetical protein